MQGTPRAGETQEHGELVSVPTGKRENMAPFGDRRNRRLRHGVLMRGPLPHRPIGDDEVPARGEPPGHRPVGAKDTMHGVGPSQGLGFEEDREIAAGEERCRATLGRHVAEVPCVPLGHKVSEMVTQKGRRRVAGSCMCRPIRSATPDVVRRITFNHHDDFLR